MRRIAGIALGLALAGAVMAQDDAPLPAENAALAAIDERPLVREALAMRAAADARAEALSVGTHEFMVGGGWHQRDVDGEGSFDEWEATLARGVRWPGKARIDRDLGNVEIEAAENALADARHGEALGLLDAWLGWLRAEAIARRDHTRADALERTVIAVRRQAEVGEASQMQLELAESESARATAVSSRSSIAARQARHALQIAYPVLDVPLQPPEVPAPTAPDRALEDWPAVVLERSHELRLAEIDEQRARLQATRASTDRWPDPVIGIRMLNERDGAEDAVGLTLAVPLPGRHRSALAAQSRQEAEAAAARLELRRREITAIARQDVADATGALAAWPAMQNAGAQAERFLGRAERAYSLGETGLGELLIAVATATETIHEAYLARLDAHAALARLRIDAHELWAAPGHDEHGD